MKIDDTILEKLSRLSKIHVSEEERPKLEQQLSAILAFVETLNQVNVKGVEPTSQITGLQTVVRDDEVTADYDREEILATMPDTTGDGHLRVHAVFNKKKDD